MSSKKLKSAEPAKKRKPPKDRGFRKYTIRLRKILYNGFFVNLPMDSAPAKELEGQVLLWRAVIDQNLKDIIEHHMVKRNFYQYYDAKRFVDEQLSGQGQECALAFLDPEQTHDRIMQFEGICRKLRDNNIQL